MCKCVLDIVRIYCCIYNRHLKCTACMVIILYVIHETDGVQSSFTYALYDYIDMRFVLYVTQLKCSVRLYGTCDR